MATVDAIPIETIALEHLPADCAVHVAVFEHVQNAAFLHGQLLARNAQFEYAFVDASVAVSRLHVLAAVFKAVNQLLEGSLKTPNVHSEIVASLSASNNIADAYRRFGIGPATKSLVVVKVLFTPGGGSTGGNRNKDGVGASVDPSSPAAPTSAADVAGHLAAHVQGTPVSFTDERLAALTDWAKVRKYYKLNGLPWLDAIKDERQRRARLEELVLGAMALRGL